MSGKITILLFAAFLIWFNPKISGAADRVFNLTIDEVAIDVAPDLKYKVFAFNRQVPGPLMHVQEGDDLTVHVTNNTALPHTIHWHGFHQLNNWRNDGVPGVTQKDIGPGETFTYTMKADRIGTLWYHCHVNVNEHVGIRGMWGPIVVAPKNPLPVEAEVTKEVIMMMSTWESVHAEKYGEGAIPGSIEDYFSINARSFPSTQPIRIKTGDVVRVRMIGAGGAIHAMHSHGHDMLVTHKDGLPLSAPYSVDTILIGPGERYDMIIRANHDEGRFIFHDHVDKHVTAGGKFPGGPITIMEYAGTAMDDWYAWKDIKYDANFFYSESMKKGFGMFANPAFIGETIKRQPRHKANNLKKRAAAPKSRSTATSTPAAGSVTNLLQERCASCHDLTGPAAKSITELKARKGPDLFYAGNKYRADWLEGWLQKPVRIRPAGAFYLNHIKPGVKQDEIDSATLKPHLALTPKDAAAAAKALMALKANSKLLGPKPFTPGPAPMGEMSFDKFYGCAACHEVEPGFGGKSGPEVYTAGRRLTPEFMVSFIRDPQAWNPKGLMPNKHVPEANIPKLVNFLLERARENLQ